jgi:hypothetical protein
MDLAKMIDVKNKIKKLLTLILMARYGLWAFIKARKRSLQQQFASHISLILGPTICFIYLADFSD